MQKKGQFDYILLETTGLADPGPIASMFWLDEGLGSEIMLDGELNRSFCLIRVTAFSHTESHIKYDITVIKLIFYTFLLFSGIITVVDAKHCIQVVILYCTVT